MNFEPTDTQRMLRDAAQSYAGDRLARIANAGAAGRHRDDWALLADMGWLALLMPEDEGGLAGGPVEISILCEARGAGHAREPYVETAVAGALALLGAADPARWHAERRRLAQGRLKVAWMDGDRRLRDGMPCPAVALRTVRDGLALDGAQSILPGAAAAEAFIVSAADELGREALCWVDAGAPGVERQPYETIDGGQAARVTLRQVIVPRDSLIRDPGDAAELRQRMHAWSSIGLCAEAVGAMQALHDQTLEYLKVRRQFGRPIGSFQVLQHAQVQMLIGVELSRSMLLAAAMALADGLPQAARLVDQAVITLGQHGRTLRHGAVQLHGGIGMTAELPIGDHFKRLTVIEQQLGSPEQRLRRLAA